MRSQVEGQRSRVRDRTDSNSIFSSLMCMFSKFMCLICRSISVTGRTNALRL